MKQHLPWEITRDMFLNEAEANGLLAYARAKVTNPSGLDSIGAASARLDQVIIETLVFSGIRNSELCRLRLGDLCVAESGCSLQVRGVKDESRTVHIPRALGILLTRFVSEVRPRLMPPERKPDDPDECLVFNDRRRPFERTGLYRRVTRILTDAGLGERASVQLLRHTYGYLAYKRTGGNLLFVQRQLGHAHPMITSVYAHLVDEPYQEMADRLYQQD